MNPPEKQIMTDLEAVELATVRQWGRLNTLEDKLEDLRASLYGVAQIQGELIEQVAAQNAFNQGLQILVSAMLGQDEDEPVREVSPGPQHPAAQPETLEEIMQRAVR